MPILKHKEGKSSESKQCQSTDATAVAPALQRSNNLAGICPKEVHALQGGTGCPFTPPHAGRMAHMHVVTREHVNAGARR